MPHRFQYDARHPNLMQGQRDTQSSDAAPGNEDRSTIHQPARISALLLSWITLKNDSVRA
jgi:hypothetical protein